MGGKSRRQSLIAGLLRERPVRSQEELKALLERRGVEVTQATLSRDMRDLGVMKSPAGYAMPGEANGVHEGGAAPAGVQAEFERTVRAYVLEVTAAGTLVVIKTGPGRAQAVSLELDRVRLEHVVGTVAGDDTIFVATPSEAAARSLRKRVAGLAGLG